MTNQEIYNDLGQIGVVALVCMEMAGSDGKVDKVEIAEIIKVVKFFSDEDPEPPITKAIDYFNKLEMEKRVNFVINGLKHLGEVLNDATKKNILLALAAVAEADGIVDENEQLVYNTAKKILS